MSELLSLLGFLALITAASWARGDFGCNPVAKAINGDYCEQQKEKK